jgi:ubiquinone/menaquinone biosynthesis C-methylase UbiE
MMAEHHFVEDYEKHVAELLLNRPLDEAMSMAVGGSDVSDYETVGRLESHLLRAVGLAQGMRLIDLGCGSGRLAAALHGTLEISYTGIDIIQPLLDYAKKKAPAYDFILHRELSIPQPSGSADMICAFSLFTHLLHAETYIYLEEARRILKPGGRIVFSFLEFSESTHWDIFVSTINGYKVGVPPLVMYIERSAIKIWASHLNLAVEKFYSAADAFENYRGLGQAVVVLRKMESASCD